MIQCTVISRLGARITAKRGQRKKARNRLRGLKLRPSPKKTVSKIRPGWTIEDYRDAHKQIPGKLYKADAKSTKTVRKTNYAPLGRPPEVLEHRVKYNNAKARLTPHGERVQRRQRRAHRNGSYAPSQEEWARYIKAEDRYEDMLAEEGMLIKGMRADEIYTELEDRGYSDKRKGWKRMSDRNRQKALYEEQYRDWKTYNDY